MNKYDPWFENFRFYSANNEGDSEFGVLLAALAWIALFVVVCAWLF